MSSAKEKIMKLSAQTARPQKHHQDCLIIGCFEKGELTTTAKDIDKTSQGAITKLITQGTFQGKLGQILPLFNLANTPYKASEIIIDLPADNNSDQAAISTALRQGEAIASGVIFTKNLANTPSNICTPEFLAAQAKDLAKVYSTITVNVLDENALHKLG